MSAGTLTVENPATRETAGQVTALDDADVQQVVERARAAQRAWKALGADHRGELMLELRAWLVRNRRRVIDTLVAETGKTYEDALQGELYYLAPALGFWARQGPRLLRDERHRLSTRLLVGRRVVVRYEPRGVVGVIAPWNYPLVAGVGDAIPALVAGNAVVIKPSRTTPLATLLVVEEGMRAAGFPPDVCLVATGAGTALVDHVDMVMFTGSTEVGRRIGVRAAERLIPCSLELGGKDPMIVLRDADIARAAHTAVYWGLCNAGQLCQSIERIYVEEPVHDEFVAAVTDQVRALRVGSPRGPGSVDVGAMTDDAQVEIVEAHVRDAVEKGARVLVGGTRKPEAGLLYEPTVLVDVDHSMLCMREETFGPTLPIMRVRDEEEAICLANDSPFGLNSAVFTRDAAHGERIARRIEAGSCCVNDALSNYIALGAPFGGWKESGVGERHGAGGIRKYCKPQTIVIDRLPVTRELHMLPNRRAESRLFDWTLRLVYGWRPWRRSRRRERQA